MSDNAAGGIAAEGPSGGGPFGQPGTHATAGSEPSPVAKAHEGRASEPGANAEEGMGSGPLFSRSGRRTSAEAKGGITKRGGNPEANDHGSGARDLESGTMDSSGGAKSYGAIPHAIFTMLAGFSGCALFFCMVAAWEAWGSSVRVCGRELQIFAPQNPVSLAVDPLNRGALMPAAIREYVDAEIKKAGLAEHSGGSASSVADGASGSEDSARGIFNFLFRGCGPSVFGLAAFDVLLWCRSEKTSEVAIAKAVEQAINAHIVATSEVAIAKAVEQAMHAQIVAAADMKLNDILERADDAKDEVRDLELQGLVRIRDGSASSSYWRLVSFLSGPGKKPVHAVLRVFVPSVAPLARV